MPVGQRTVKCVSGLLVVLLGPALIAVAGWGKVV